MALIISDRCINCGYCRIECPNAAIYEPGEPWSMEEGTGLQGKLVLQNGEEVMAGEMLPAKSEEYYFIVPDKCTRCLGIYNEPQCRVVCPDPESIMIDPEFKGREADLKAKQSRFKF